METMVKTDIEQEVALKYSDPNIGTPLPGDGDFRSTIEYIKHIQMYSYNIVDDIKRINKGMKKLFGNVPVPVSGIVKLLSGINNMSSTTKNPSAHMDGFNCPAKSLSSWLNYPDIKGFEGDIDTLVKRLDKWRMFIGDPKSKEVNVPVTNFSIENAYIEKHGCPYPISDTRYETLCIKTTFNVKGYDQKITMSFILGDYLPEQDIEQYIPHVENKIATYFRSYGMFPGILYLVTLDNSLNTCKLGYIRDVLVPQFTFDAEKIIYKIIKENMANSK